MSQVSQKEISIGKKPVAIDDTSQFEVMLPDEVIKKWDEKTQQDLLQYYNSGGDNYEVGFTQAIFLHL